MHLNWDLSGEGAMGNLSQRIQHKAEAMIVLEKLMQALKENIKAEVEVIPSFEKQSFIKSKVYLLP